MALNAVRVSTLVFVAGCTFGEGDTDKANERVKEARVLVEEAMTLQKDAARETSQEPCESKHEAASEKLDKASSHFDEASKMKVSKVFSEHLDLKAKQFSKLAEAFRESQKTCSPTADRKAIEKQRDALLEEADAFQKKAEKIREENKDQFTD